MASSAVAATALATVTWGSATRRTARLDRRAGPRLAVRKSHPARQAATFVAPVGKWYSQIAIAAALSAALAARRNTRRPAAGAAAIVASALLAAGAGMAFDRVLPQPPVPPGHRKKRKPVFPSGHTIAPLAVAMTASWIGHREGVVDGRIAIPLALLTPLVTASGKLMERKHWLSDVVGGYAAGIAIATSVLALYESTGEER